MSSTDGAMLTLPWFEPAHHDLAARLAIFARESIEPFAAASEDGDPIVAGRGVIQRAADADVLTLFAGNGQAAPGLRMLCLAREAIAARSGFADSSVRGARTRLLPDCSRGDRPAEAPISPGRCDWDGRRRLCAHGT